MPSQTRRRPNSFITRRTRSVSTRRPRSVPTRRVSLKNKVNPLKFTRIIVGKSPKKNSPMIRNSPTIFKSLDKNGLYSGKPKPDYTNVRVPNNIPPDDVEGYQMAKLSSKEARKLVKDHLNEYIKDNPLSTYEEWIRALFPDNTEEKNGHIEIDPRLYLPDADTLNYWMKNHKWMKDHLEDHIRNLPGSTYEQWIRELFPKNTKIKNKYIILDERLYLPQAESLKYWINIKKK